MKMKTKKFVSVLFGVAFALVLNIFYCYANEFEDAEFLYSKINEFLIAHKDVNPEMFDDVCKEFMGGTIPKTNLLDKQDFEKKSKRNIVLYRGVENKKYADEFKQGKVYLSCWGVRGSGVYTTTSLRCAESYANKENFNDTIIEMFISKSNAKILDNDYLEKLKKIIIEKHKVEFGEFESNYRNEYVFDSSSSYNSKIFAMVYQEVVAELSGLGLSDDDYLKEEARIFKKKMSQVKESAVYQKVFSEKKRYYKSNKAYVWFNSGLLAKLLGYDVLYTKDLLSKDYEFGNEEEYLIINANILNVLQK